MANMTAHYGIQTWQELQQIAQFGYPMSEVFRDFIEVCLNMLLCKRCWIIYERVTQCWCIALTS